MRMYVLPALLLTVLSAPALRAQSPMMADTTHHPKPAMMGHAPMMADTGRMAHGMTCDSMMAAHGGMMGDSGMMGHDKMMADSGMMKHDKMMGDSTMMAHDPMSCGKPMMGHGRMMNDSSAHAPMQPSRGRRASRPARHQGHVPS